MAKKSFADVREMFPSVSDVRGWHDALISRVASGRGGVEYAMRRLEQLFGLPFGAQWNLRYRRDRKPSVPFMMQVRAAYLRALERSVRRDAEALKAEMAKGHAEADLAGLVDEVEALMARLEEKKKELAEWSRTVERP